MFLANLNKFYFLNLLFDIGFGYRNINALYTSNPKRFKINKL